MAHQYFNEAKKLGRAFRRHDIYVIDNILGDRAFFKWFTTGRRPQVCYVVQMLWINNETEMLHHLNQKYKIDISRPLIFSHETKNIDE